jgi:hypothetical protein
VACLMILSQPSPKVIEENQVKFILSSPSSGFELGSSGIQSVNGALVMII